MEAVPDGKRGLMFAVLSGFGINCETETMAVFEMAGATPSACTSTDSSTGNSPSRTMTCFGHLGGFSFGDHLGSGRLMGNRLRFGLGNK